MTEADSRAQLRARSGGALPDTPGDRELARAPRPPVCSTSPTPRSSPLSDAAARGDATRAGARSRTSTATEDADLEPTRSACRPECCARLRRLDEPRRELDEYFAGRRTSRLSSGLDWRLTRFGLDAGARRHRPRFPMARSRATRRVAAEAGSPRGSRAAGNALGANPLPIVVPCHRVLHTGGGLGGYTGGLERKRTLLAIERQRAARGVSGPRVAAPRRRGGRSGRRRPHWGPCRARAGGPSRASPASSPSSPGRNRAARQAFQRANSGSSAQQGQFGTHTPGRTGALASSRCMRGQPRPRPRRRPAPQSRSICSASCRADSRPHFRR